MRSACQRAFPLIVVISLVQTLSGRGASARVAPGNPTPVWSTTFSLDGVEVELRTSFLGELLPGAAWTVADPDAFAQVATTVERSPAFRELSITAVPWGVSPPTEALPRAEPGGGEAYRTALRAYRAAQQGNPREGPTIRLFGEDVAGSTSMVAIPIDSEVLTPVAITEWVAEAGRRIWIVRASQELGRDEAVRPEPAHWALMFSNTELRSDDVHQPSTSLTAMRGTPSGAAPYVAERLGSSLAAPDLPFPAWWSGECDVNNYLAVTGRASYPLGAAYRGMKACGPRPWADYGPEVWVNFGAGVSQIEWQCPELSKRFLYLAYGIPPYSANGSQVVWNYTGDLLEKISNCEPGRAPEPDDVLSYGSTSTYGHTSVVMASDVDSSGNGTIEVIEQNSSASGSSAINVSNWCVMAYSTVSGWLHTISEELPAIWLVEYFSDDHLGNLCSTVYQEGTYVFGNWGSGAPAVGCPSDHFSARFSRTVDFAGGAYTLGLGYDDGARLKVDGDTVVDGWGTAAEHYETLEIEAGSHEVIVEFTEGVGEAHLTAFWWGPGFDLARESRDNTQWYAQYWGNQILWWDPVVMENEGRGFLEHHWVDLGPSDGFPEDHFGARFERTVHFGAGPWRFHVSSDDGVRFWIDGGLIVDEWQDQVADFVEDVELEKGDHELTVEHYENEGWAFIELWWEWMGPRPWKMFLPTLLARHVGGS